MCDLVGAVSFFPLQAPRQEVFCSFMDHLVWPRKAVQGSFLNWRVVCLLAASSTILPPNQHSNCGHL
uniref:Uncharacterized protein n=1 Tax=Anguilla anguilla TaxID=7936 RepID=A0A0E9R038_ANGAN